MAGNYLYKVIFVNHSQIYEVFVKNVHQGDLYGFVIIEDFVFGEKTSLVVDPSEERLRTEFEGVSRAFIPLQRIIRIDQVKKRGTAKIAAISKDDAGLTAKLAAFQPADKK